MPAFRRVDAAWTGPETRARQTAEALRLQATVDPVLRDIDLGRWAGRSFDTVLAAEPEAIAAWTRDPDAAPHGGESVTALLDRIRPWLDTVGRDARHVVAITHPAVIRAAVTIALDAGAGSFWRIDVAPLCRVTAHQKRCPPDVAIARDMTRHQGIGRADHAITGGWMA